MVDEGGMFTIDYIGDGKYGVFNGFDFSAPLMVSEEVCNCIEWANARANGAPLLYSHYIKEIALLELASMPLD